MPAPSTATNAPSGGSGVLNSNNNSNNMPQYQSQQQQSQQAPRPQLRRATYVHVSDLTSAYNIDHVRLEEELKRVKQERENPAAAGSEANKRTSGGSNEQMDPAGNNTSSKRLQPPRGGYNLCLLVGSVQVVVDKFRVDGSRVRLAEVEVGDETGTVSLRARDDQIDLLTEISQRQGAVVLRNSTLELYQGKHIRLAVTKWGKLTPYPDQVASTPAPPSRMNNDRYFSLIDLSAVASEMVVFSSSQNEAPNSYSATNPSNPTLGGGASNNPNTTRSDYENANPAASLPHMRGSSGHHHHQNRNTRGPGRMRGKSQGGGMKQQQQHHQQQQQQQQGIYQRYPTTLHNYGYGSTEMEAQQPQHHHHHPHHHAPHTAMYHGYQQHVPPPRQQQPPQQQMMMQHQQYELHHHQQHQHRLAQQQQQQQQQAQQMQQLHGHYQPAPAPDNRAPTLATGAPPMQMLPPSAAAFDTHGGFAPTPYSPSPGGTLAPLPAVDSPSRMEHSPRMNPQAPTFDPATHAAMYGAPPPAQNPRKSNNKGPK
eukprot:CAMPEP_0172441126 /NCGR_PEP_ID=MMETSP1065-20121228/1696_1 /TAXON_ID=265537 /ORGANISM="Amphiprora paludosa, Strain CCMP125" /LENGTH=536 /DNA_ID=CAMNT_0013190323 /DNA_START=194 /DNA_END=1804 /DNA_ORIENTATION=-